MIFNALSEEWLCKTSSGLKVNEIRHQSGIELHKNLVVCKIRPNCHNTLMSYLWYSNNHPY
jgi:hypothetical protein